MLVRMLTDYTTSEGACKRGDVLPLSPAEAGRLIRSGWAESATDTIETASIVHPQPHSRATRRYRRELVTVGTQADNSADE